MQLSADMTAPPSDDRAQRRAAAAQALLRHLNDCMRGGDRDPIVFRCECGRLGCNTLIALTREQYDALRTGPRRFVVVPGHEIAEIEHVVERHERHAIVETHAPPAVEVAERTAAHG